MIFSFVFSFLFLVYLLYGRGFDFDLITSPAILGSFCSSSFVLFIVMLKLPFVKMIQIFYHIYFNFLEIVSWSWKLSGTFMNKIINQSMFNSKNKFQEFTFLKKYYDFI